jgi:hypothetical protein
MPVVSDMAISLWYAPWDQEIVGLWGNQDCNSQRIVNIQIYGEGGHTSSFPYNKHQGLRLSVMRYDTNGVPIKWNGSGWSPIPHIDYGTELFGTGNGTIGPYTHTMAHGVGCDVNQVITYTSGGVQKTIHSDGFGYWYGCETPTGVTGSPMSNPATIEFPQTAPPDNGTPIYISYYYSWDHNNHDGLKMTNCKFGGLENEYGALCIEPNQDANTMTFEGMDFGGTCRVNIFSYAYGTNFNSIGNEQLNDAWNIAGTLGGWSVQNVLLNQDNAVHFTDCYYENNFGVIFLKQYTAGYPLLQIGTISGGTYLDQFMSTQNYGDRFQATYVDATHFTVKGDKTGFYGLATIGSDGIGTSLVVETAARNRFVYQVTDIQYNAGTGLTTVTVSPTAKRTSYYGAPGPLPTSSTGGTIITAWRIGDNNTWFSVEDPTFPNMMAETAGTAQKGPMQLDNFRVGRGVPGIANQPPVGDWIGQTLSGVVQKDLGTCNGSGTNGGITDITFILPNVKVGACCSITPYDLTFAKSIPKTISWIVVADNGGLHMIVRNTDVNAWTPATGQYWTYFGARSRDGQ